MFREANQAGDYRGRDQTGAVISKYAGIIEDRLDQTNYCAAIEGLLTYPTFIIEQELERRRSEND